MDMNTLRSFSKGEISAEQLKASINESTTEEITEEVAEFIQECTNDAIGLILQGEIMDESADAYDKSINESYANLQPYLVGQGLMNEATISITNPRVNYVRLNKQAQINRLRKIIIIKLARNAGRPAYKKYKIGTLMKRKNMEQMEKEFGARAERLAKQVWSKTMRNGKVKAKVEEVKKDIKKK